jgi:hypothetical protein
MLDVVGVVGSTSMATWEEVEQVVSMPVAMGI